MRMGFERFCCRFMRLRLNNRVQHDIVFGIGNVLTCNALGLAYPAPISANMFV